MAEDLYYAEIVGDRAISRNLEQLPDQVHYLLRAKVTDWTEELADRVRENIYARLKGYGRLAQEVQYEVIDNGVKIDGRVFIEGVPYAGIQDKGGVIPAHIIRPRNGKVLAFMGATGDKVFAARVFHPGGVIPASNYMSDARREMATRIGTGVKKAIVQGIRENMRSGTNG